MVTGLKRTKPLAMLTATGNAPESVRRIRDAADHIRRVTQRDAGTCIAALQRCTAQVREASLRTFESTDKVRWRLLQEAFNGRGVPLAALSVCGRGTREIRYTQLLGYFLDPSKPHGLGSRVLRAVLMPDLSQLGEHDFDHAVVTPEFGLGEISAESRRLGSTLDLFIRMGDFYVLIEQKLGSAEGANQGAGSQLSKYARTVLQNHSHITAANSLWLYLTPTRRPPRSVPVTGAFPHWRPVAHADWFTRIAGVLGEESLSQVARHNLCCLLWDLMMGPLAVDETKLDVLRAHVKTALEKPERHVALEQWCGVNLIHTGILLKILEVSYGDNAA